MRSKTEIINYLISKYKYKVYLEIGVQLTSLDFKKISAEKKVGVDPIKSDNISYVGTSNSFFKQNKLIFDIILIDGLHEHKQVLLDIENSLKCLSKNGTIVMHDCNPMTVEMQAVPRIQTEWTGDVWKAFVETRTIHTDLKMFVIATDYGVGIIQKSDSKQCFKAIDLTYANLDNNREEWLNLIEPIESDIEMALSKENKTTPENKISNLYTDITEILFLYNKVNIKTDSIDEFVKFANIVKEIMNTVFFKREFNYNDTKKTFAFPEKLKEVRGSELDPDIIVKHVATITKDIKTQYIYKLINAFKLNLHLLFNS